MQNDDKSKNILGIKPYGESIKILAKGVVDGATAFLSRICLPAAEEYGLLLKDKVHIWRTVNAVKTLKKAEKKLKKYTKLEKYSAQSRLVSSILEQSSWINDDKLQNMWAGLLASSCSKDGKDDSNLIFINILSQITSLQALILNYACTAQDKLINDVGAVSSEMVTLRKDDLFEITGLNDFFRLDRELDHLRTLGLIQGGFGTIGGIIKDLADITPSDLALQLYVRCQGFSGSPDEYFGLKEK